jgi:hypothetical protein
VRAGNRLYLQLRDQAVAVRLREAFQASEVRLVVQPVGDIVVIGCCHDRPPCCPRYARPIPAWWPAVWPGAGGVSTTPVTGEGCRPRSIMKHSRNPSHPGADEGHSRASPRQLRRGVTFQDACVGAEVIMRPVAGRSAALHPHAPPGPDGGRRCHRHAGVQWGTCASITACCVSASGRMHRPPWRVRSATALLRHTIPRMAQTPASTPVPEWSATTLVPRGAGLPPLYARLIGRHRDNWLSDGLKHIPLTP